MQHHRIVTPDGRPLDFTGDLVGERKQQDGRISLYRRSDGRFVGSIESGDQKARQLVAVAECGTRAEALEWLYSNGMTSRR